MDYEQMTKEQLIAEVARLKKYYQTLVNSILNHYRGDSGKQVTTMPERSYDG